MLTIKLDLDLKYGLDEIDVLGDLSVSDGHFTILVKTTYLDSWLVELIDAANRLPKAGHIDAAIEEEPEPMQLELTSEKRVRLCRKGQIVVADSMADFNAALQDAAKSLLDAVGSLPQSHINASLDRIREYYQKKPGSGRDVF